MAITPTTLTATELADHLTEQAIPLRALFDSGNPDTATGAMVLHDGVFDLVRALRAGDVAPVVAQIRLLGLNRRVARYHVRWISARRDA
ncbi:hypothetical protein [Streptomyces sp. NPDC086782]|uniref:hypothetical protein n=1 Tax=Streptomyces sp. NPDC086782 TaxID=3365757 RepID=UPI003829F0E1